MSRKPLNKLLVSLKKLRENLQPYRSVELRSTVIKELDQLIFELSDLRARLTKISTLDNEIPTIAAFDEIVRFLERAKSDDGFLTLFAPTRLPAGRARIRAAAQAIEIPPNLTNQQIRELLQRDLSKSELQAIARQRSISIGKRSTADLRSAILAFIERQDSYDRLRG